MTGSRVAEDLFLGIHEKIRRRHEMRFELAAERMIYTFEDLCRIGGTGRLCSERNLEH